MILIAILMMQGEHHAAIALHNQGKVNLLAHIISTRTSYAGGSAKSISDWWGDTTPIGTYQGSLGRTHDGDSTPPFNWAMKLLGIILSLEF